MARTRRGGIRVSSPSCKVDRISTLPDDVLVHILSFLCTKYSVATRILSTRWKHLFASVPILDFGYSYYLTYTEHSFNTGTRFLEFVDWVFQFHGFLHIIKFRFNCYGYDIPSNRLETWISRVLCSGVREIDIKANFLHQPVFQCCRFSCETLQILKLGGNCVLSILDSVSLPCLRTLQIRHAHFDKSSWRPFPRFQVLENLLILDSRAQDVEVDDIPIPTLKMLIIENFECDTLLLNVPILEHIKFVDSFTGEIRGESLKSLHGAIISPFGNYPSFIKLLELVCNAHHLYLCSSFGGVLDDIVNIGFYDLPLPTFQSLSRLELGCVSRRNLGLLMGLIERSANLQVLAFPKKVFDSNASNDWFFPEIVSACASLHLRQIEFRQFSMLDNECKLVKYFMENAKYLDKMVIQPSLSLRMQDEMRSKLQSFSSYSITCQVVIE